MRPTTDADLELVASTLLSHTDDPSFESLMDAFFEIFKVAQRRPDLDLSRLSLVPELADIQNAARADLAAKAAARARAEYLAALPSAAELLKQANEAGDRFEFESYTLWREEGGWSLTNAYGVDYCSFLSSEADFERLLRCERKGEHIGPVPPCCEDPDDDPEKDYQLDSSHDAALALSRRIEDPAPLRTTDSVDAPCLYDLAMAARIEYAMMKILQAGGDRETPATEMRRARAYGLAEGAGYAFEPGPPPNLLAGELELLRAWMEGVARRQRETQSTREQRRELRTQLHAVIGTSAPVASVS